MVMDGGCLVIRFFGGLTSRFGAFFYPWNCGGMDLFERNWAAEWTRFCTCVYVDGPVVISYPKPQKGD